MAAEVGTEPDNDRWIVGALELKDSKPIPIIRSTLSGGSPIPEVLQNQLMGILQPFLDQWTAAEFNYVVENVEIAEDRLVMEGHYK